MKRLPKVLVFSFYFLALLAAYILFGLGSLAVSDRDVERHVRQTVEQSDLKADFWFAFLYKPNYYMDNFTDALIVNQAWCLGDAGDTLNARQRLMLVPRRTGGGEECESLRRLTEGDSTMRTICYPRYWHGSTYLMRYLLAIDDYVVLRGFFYLLSSLLLLWLLLALARRVGVWASALFFLAFVLVDGFMMQFSIQFLPVLLIALAGSLWVLYRKDSSLGIAFFVLGSLTAYFDLLTAPLLTWGLPLLVLVIASDRGSHSSLTHSSVSQADSWLHWRSPTFGSPNLGEQPEIQPASHTASDIASDRVSHSSLTHSSVSQAAVDSTRSSTFGSPNLGEQLKIQPASDRGSHSSLTHSSVSQADSSPNLGEQPEIQPASHTASDIASDRGSHSSLTHSSVSQADSSPNLGEQLRIQPAPAHSSPKLGEVAQRAGGVCQLPASLLWPIGYAATWGAKWLLATLTTPMNVFSDASAQASVRAAVEDYSRWEAVGRNLDLVPWLYVAIAAGVLAFLAVRHFRKEGWRQALLCLAVALAPLAWYLVLANHSYEHYWFTYRSLAITVLGLLLALASLINWGRVKLKSKN